MTPGKKQASALGGTAGLEDQATEERIAEITSGRTGLAHELVEAMKKE